MIKRIAVAMLGLLLASTMHVATAADDPTSVVRDTAERVLDSLRGDRARYQDDEALFELVT